MRHLLAALFIFVAATSQAEGDREVGRGIDLAKSGVIYLDAPATEIDASDLIVVTRDFIGPPDRCRADECTGSTCRTGICPSTYLLAQAAAPTTLKVTGSASFDGSSDATLGTVDFHGDCGETVTGQLQLENRSVTGTVEVPLAKCKTGKEGRDEHMAKAFDVAKHPNVKLTLKPTKLAPGKVPVDGVLTIKGSSAPAKGWCALDDDPSTKSWEAGCELAVDLRLYPTVSTDDLAALAGLLSVNPLVAVQLELRAAPQ